ncbi:MAG: Secretion system C-terminal sorting domain [Bacteroidota bacterium]
MTPPYTITSLKAFFTRLGMPMRRIYSFTLLLAAFSGLVSFSSFRNEPEGSPVLYNTPLRLLFHPDNTTDQLQENSYAAEPDSSVRMQVLMLNYSEYGKAYNEKVQAIISRNLPRVTFTEYASTDLHSLEVALQSTDAVVIAYPSAAASSTLLSYSKLLKKFVQGGGSVIVTGTHEFEVLQQFDLIDLDFGYFSKEVPVHCLNPEHPLLQGEPTEFSTTNFAYPLDISDPAFVSVAEVGGYPAAGYKQLGNGKVIYLGVEYYYDEEAPSRLLINALSWTARKFSAESSEPVKPVRRNEEVLLAGSVKLDNVDLKVYPNPYVSKATLDLELVRPANVRIEMTDESGRSVAVILPKRPLGAGLCRFELPNIAPGIYFVQVQIGEQLYMKKVIKSEAG